VKRVYIAGPFRAPTGYEVAQNVRRAGDFILPLAEAGACPVCPHTMTADLDGTMTDAYWIAATLSLLDGCNAVLQTPGWEESEGSLGEYARARELGLPVFEATQAATLPLELVEWLERNES